jgi:signal transduction histidine kinase
VTALRGNVEYLRRHGHEDAVVADLTADAARLGDLIDDLLALSREDAAGAPADDVRLDELVKAQVAGDRLVAVEAPAPVAVRGDRAALERAVANLIENARVHGLPEGRITVRVETAGDVARLVVRDEGEGLTPEQAEHAFERFWRGRRDTPGSGLGLAIVRATAERHGGHATAVGSEFTLELPLLRELSNDPGTPGDVSQKEGSP